eukprot:1959960-Pyramimonas_sp.AAC.1
MGTQSTSQSPPSVPLFCLTIGVAGRNTPSPDLCRRLAGVACRCVGRRTQRRPAPPEGARALGAG